MYRYRDSYLSIYKLCVIVFLIRVLGKKKKKVGLVDI